MATKKLVTINEVISFFLMINVRLDIVRFNSMFKVTLPDGFWFIMPNIEDVPTAVLQYMAMHPKFAKEINLSFQN